MSDEKKTTPPQRQRRPAKTVHGRENQLISMATDLAEKRLKEGTATAQEIVHFLKLGSTREQLEQEKLRRENDVLTARVETMESAVRMEELYRDAIRAMSEYKGDDQDEEDFYED